MRKDIGYFLTSISSSTQQRRRRQSFARVQRAPDDARLGALRQLGDRVDRLGGIALRVAHDQLDLAAVDAACIVDLIDRELGPSVDPDACRGARARERRQIPDLDRFIGGDRRRREARRQRDGAGSGTCQHLPTVDWATLDRHAISSHNTSIYCARAY
jgi:hypothetical protein